MSKRSRILLALPFVIAVGVVGCGDNSPTAVGDTVAPSAVLDLGATVVDDLTGHSVQVTWAPSSEPDLAGYNVYRSTNGQVATLVSVETSNTYRDVSVEVGTSYSYGVSSVDRSGNESARVSTASVLVWDGNPRRNVRND